MHTSADEPIPFQLSLHLLQSIAKHRLETRQWEFRWACRTAQGPGIKILWFKNLLQVKEKEKQNENEIFTSCGSQDLWTIVFVLGFCVSFSFSPSSPEVDTPFSGLKPDRPRATAAAFEVL